MLRSRRTFYALLLVLTGVACATEPGPVSDAGISSRRSPRGVRIHGVSRVLVIPAKFAGGAPEPLSGTAIRNELLSTDAVTQAFKLSSSGTFTLQLEVTNWVQTEVASAELTHPGVIAPTREGDYVLAAIRAVDAMVDFGRYDNDGPDGFPNSGDDDGIVDGGVVILNSDQNKTCDTVARGLHPHALFGWRDKNGVRFRTDDIHQTAKDTAPRGIEVGGYVAMGVLSCGTDVGANVLTHELAHLLFGLPDMYHVVGGGAQIWEGRRWVVGCWELMAAGSGWGCGAGFRASSGVNLSVMGAWARTRVGWGEPITVRTDRDTVYTLYPPASGATVLRVPVTDSEYFLVEYREPSGVDAMPPAAGVLIYHVDERLPMLPAVTAPRLYRIRLMEADDGDQLIRTDAEGGDRGAAGDAFGSTQKSFMTGSHSGARTTSGAALPFSITEITIDAARHRATVRIKPS